MSSITFVYPAHIALDKKSNLPKYILPPAGGKKLTTEWGEGGHWSIYIFLSFLLSVKCQSKKTYVLM